MLLRQVDCLNERVQGGIGALGWGGGEVVGQGGGGLGEGLEVLLGGDLSGGGGLLIGEQVGGAFVMGQ